MGIMDVEARSSEQLNVRTELTERASLHEFSHARRRPPRFGDQLRQGIALADHYEVSSRRPDQLLPKAQQVSRYEKPRSGWGSAPGGNFTGRTGPARI